ncbi:hypothetical protein [Lysinibacillus sp. 54212]|uniref:hypothetical protein n=1 Tax=Lysinibacillus sp. 54212 TaxID=3119829 RepID=UPI002FCB8E11
MELTYTRIEALDRQTLLFNNRCRKCPYRQQYNYSDACLKCPVRDEFIEIGSVLDATIKQKVG